MEALAIKRLAEKASLPLVFLIKVLYVLCRTFQSDS